MRVTHVLLTHEHGDHAPGAYLWRVATGARVVASAETAYLLRHLAPACSGYGFHPPNPVDLVLTEDRELDLAALKVNAIRLPGHTDGSRMRSAKTRKRAGNEAEFRLYGSGHASAPPKGLPIR